VNAGFWAKQSRRLVTAVGTSVAVAATFATSAGAATTTFSNEVPVAIPEFGNAAPYPSSITASGMTGGVADVTVTLAPLNNFSHERPNDVGMVLVGPSGQAFALLDCLTESPASGVSLTLSDAGVSALPSVGELPPGGIFLPTNHCTAIDDYPDPGPGQTYANPAPAGSATFGSTFGGTEPNGVWNLFVRDFVMGDDGQFGGWSLTITTPDPPGSEQAVTTPPATATGRRAAALKKCKKKFPKGPTRKKCIKKAKKLPV
jgi:hypothetical protein